MDQVSLKIGPIGSEDRLSDEFQVQQQQQAKTGIDDAFERMLKPAAPVIDGVTGPEPKPAAPGQPAEVTIQPKTVGQKAGEVASDVAGGVIEAPRQVAGGMLDALDEASQFLEEMVPLGEMLGGFEIIDPETGDFSFRPLSGEEMSSREDQIFKALAPAEADTATGGFIRSTSQFLTGFLPAMKAAKAAGAAGGIATQLGAGAVADAVVFDPHEARLSTFLNEVPALGAIVPDYLAETDPEKQSALEGRLKNAIEGAGLGVAAEGLMRAFKYYRAQRMSGARVKPETTAEQAAHDAIIDAARSEIIEPVDEAALRSLGDPDDAPVVVAAQDETLDTALGRLQETRARLEAEGVLPEDMAKALADESKIRPRKKAKVFLNMARIKTQDDVKDALQLFADNDAEAINAKRRGTVTNAQTKREAAQEFTELTDLIGRSPGPMSAAQAVAARRMLTTSGEQTVDLARKAADPGATSADLYNFRRAMLVHYAIQSEVIAARTETARALQSWSIASTSTKGAQGVVCVL